MRRGLSETKQRGGWVMWWDCHPQPACRWLYEREVDPKFTLDFAVPK